MSSNLAPAKLFLKKRTHWFAAGQEFIQAMEVLSDGAFKLFAFVCLKADRHTATYLAAPDPLAWALHKPPQIIESYLQELQAKGVCTLAAHPCGVGYSIRIADPFWPYHSSQQVPTTPCSGDYVATLRQLFLSLGCTSGRFGAAEHAQAQSLERRGIPLHIARDAMIMGACRKYLSWLNHGYSEPIASLGYFESLIQEFLRDPPPATYRQWLPLKLKRLSSQWSGRWAAEQKQSAEPGGSHQHDQQSRRRIRDDVEEISSNPSGKETRRC